MIGDVAASSLERRSFHGGEPRSGAELPAPGRRRRQGPHPGDGGQRRRLDRLRPGRLARSVCRQRRSLGGAGNGETQCLQCPLPEPGGRELPAGDLRSGRGRAPLGHGSDRRRLRQRRLARPLRLQLRPQPPVPEQRRRHLPGRDPGSGSGGSLLEFQRRLRRREPGRVAGSVRGQLRGIRPRESAGRVARLPIPRGPGPLRAGGASGGPGHLLPEQR